MNDFRQIHPLAAALRTNGWLVLALTAAVISVAAGDPHGATPRVSEGPAGGAGPDTGGPWKEISRGTDLVVSTRERAGSSIREVRASGRIDEPAWVVKNVLDDTERYVQFMPYTSESHVLARDPSHRVLVSYMRLNPPMVGPRDYTIRIQDESPHRLPDGSGAAYVSRWQIDNGQGPAEKPGVVRVKVNEGSWRLEPIESGRATRATYWLYTDGGGGLPAFAVNLANRQSIPELFAAVRKTAHDDRYRQNKPDERP